MIKQCTRCGEWKEESEFFKRATGKSQSECKACHREVDNVSRQKRKGEDGVNLRNRLDKFMIGEFVCF